MPGFFLPFFLHEVVSFENFHLAFSYRMTILKFSKIIQEYTPVSKASRECVVDSPNSGNVSSRAKPVDMNSPSCIIIEPTKELAEQTNAQIEVFKKYLEKPFIRYNLV